MDGRTDLFKAVSTRTYENITCEVAQNCTDAHMQQIHCHSSKDVSKYTVIYGVYQSWPILIMCRVTHT